jgi:hypothetical protein
VKLLTKLAIPATILSVAYLLLSLGLKQVMATDGKSFFTIVLWHIPFYRTIKLPDRSWWFIVRVWLVSVSIPPIMWVTVAVRYFLSKPNAN